MDKIVTNSSLNALKTCARKYRLGYVEGLRRVEVNTNIAVGVAVHEGLDVYAKSLAGGVNHETARDAGMTATIASFPDPGADRNAWLSAAMLASYLDRYKNAWARWKIVASEQTFQVYVESTGYTYAGKIDKIIEIPDKGLWLVDHKTTSDNIEPDSPYCRHLALDSQISLYWNAAKQLGYPVRGMLYDIIKRPMLAPKLLTIKESLQFMDEGAYYGRLFDVDKDAWKVGADDHMETVAISPAAKEGEFRIRETNMMYAARVGETMLEQYAQYFRQIEIPRTRFELMESHDDLQFTVQQLDWHKSKDLWPRNTSACRSRFGLCQYFDICVNGGYYAGDHVPEGYQIVEDVHPELELELVDD